MNRRSLLQMNLHSRALVLVGFVAAVTVAACGEKLDAGAACPLLCPQQSVELKDTIIYAVAVDSTVKGFPRIGEENELLLAARGDTLETRVMLRFDTLLQTYSHATAPADSFITSVDSARLRVVLDTFTIPSTPTKPTTPVTIELYDVDAATDTVASALLPLFTAGRLLGSKTFAPESLLDTLQVPVRNDVVLDRITRGTRLRIGMRLVSTVSTQLRVFAAGGNAPVLRFKPAADTTLTVSLISKTPADSTLTALRSLLSDFVIVAKELPGLPPNTIGVGGLPARRTYMRFNLPESILDSATIVRASLLLVQAPRRTSPSRGDSVAVYPVPLTAGTPLTDIDRLITFAGTTAGVGDSLRLVPSDSGARRLELVNLVRIWQTTKADQTQRAIVLRVASEALNPSELVFFSSRAGDALRPRLQLTYVPRVNLGLP